MVKLLIGCLFAWPVLALIIHMLIPNIANQTRRYAQTVFTLVWLVLSFILLINTHQTVSIMMGGWSAPFGIALISDSLSNLMLFVFAIVASCINFYSYQDTGLIKKQQGFYCGFWLLLLGVFGSIFTADVFNLYVWFEVMLVSAFILLASSQKSRPHTLMYYSIMNITGTLFMLLAVAFIYGVCGSLSYATIAQYLMQPHSSWMLPIIALFLFALGLKGAIFPLYFWLPKAYTKPNISATMLLSSLITKVVMVVLLRLAWLWLPIHGIFLAHALLWIAFATMFFGVMGAANQFRFKDILAFHIISQLGYILLAIVIPLQAAIVAAVYFIIHNIFVKTNLFLTAGTLEQHYGSDDFKKLSGILKQHKWISIVFFLAAMSLAGFPPLSGFWGKLFVIQSALKAHYYFSAFVAILVSLFTLYSMLKIWRYVFCESATPRETKAIKFSWALLISVLPLLILPILMGLFPDCVLHWLNPIANQLSHPQHYIHSILGAVS